MTRWVPASAPNTGWKTTCELAGPPARSRTGSPAPSSSIQRRVSATGTWRPGAWVTVEAGRDVGVANGGHWAPCGCVVGPMSAARGDGAIRFLRSNSCGRDALDLLGRRHEQRARQLAIIARQRGVVGV